MRKFAYEDKPQVVQPWRGVALSVECTSLMCWTVLKAAAFRFGIAGNTTIFNGISGVSRGRRTGNGSQIVAGNVEVSTGTN